MADLAALRYPWPAFRPESHGGEPVVHALGLVARAFATIQIDLNVVHSRPTGAEITMCDHNCTVTVGTTLSGGAYDCPAAVSLNRGARRSTLAPGPKLIHGLARTIVGLTEARGAFLRDDLSGYFAREEMPPWLCEQIRASLSAGGVVVNLFGGSPETHPQVCEVIKFLLDEGVEVHLTTTGRRLIRDAAFRHQFLRNPSDLIGLSADDFETADQIDFLFGLGDRELSDLWLSVPWQHGQRRKAIEAVQVCKLAERTELPPLLFNIVLHPGNLGAAQELLDRLAHHVPQAVLNPYPVQTAFLGHESELGEGHLRALLAFTDQAIAVHAAKVQGEPTRWNLAPRLGYWILMKALLSDGGVGEQGVNIPARDRVGGRDVWRCYGESGAGRCVQVGCASPGLTRTETPGGHLGCFWNTETITDPRQIWDMTPSEVATWVIDGRQASASAAPHACSGCLFPRMSMDTVSLELGLTSEVLPAYRRTRRHYLGY